MQFSTHWHGLNVAPKKKQATRSLLNQAAVAMSEENQNKKSNWERDSEAEREAVQRFAMLPVRCDVIWRNEAKLGMATTTNSRKQITRIEGQRKSVAKVPLSNNCPHACVCMYASTHKQLFVCSISQARVTRPALATHKSYHKMSESTTTFTLYPLRALFSCTLFQSVSHSVCLSASLALSLSLSENMFVFTFAFVFAFLLDLHTQYITSARDNTHKHTQRVRWRDWESEVSRLACWWCVCVLVLLENIWFLCSLCSQSVGNVCSLVWCVCVSGFVYGRAHTYKYTWPTIDAHSHAHTHSHINITCMKMRASEWNVTATTTITATW